MKTLKRYLITAGVGLLMAFLVACSYKIFEQTEATTIFYILTNSFCVSAVMIGGFGALVFVSNEGAFDGLTYAARCFMDMFRKNKKNKFHTYYDYKESKKSRNGSFAYMLLTGLGFFAVMMIMLVLYWNSL